MHVAKGVKMLTACTQVNISLIVKDTEAKQCVQALHAAFFENGFFSEVLKGDKVYFDQLSITFNQVNRCCSSHNLLPNFFTGLQGCRWCVDA